MKRRLWSLMILTLFLASSVLPVWATEAVSNVSGNDFTNLNTNGNLGNSIVIQQHQHTHGAVTGYPATCTAAGLTDGSVCSDCGEVLVAQTALQKLPHTPAIVSGTPAACTAAGLTDGSVCSVCGEVLTAQTAIPMLSHTPAAVSGTPATCDKTGLTDGSVCSACGEVLTAQKLIPAQGHNYQVIKTAGATCTAWGYTTKTCSVCNDNVTTYTTRPLTHLSGEWEPDGGHTHSTVCERENCGYVQTASCTLLTVMWNGQAITYCPMCGDTDAGVRLSMADGIYAVNNNGVRPDNEYILLLGALKDNTALLSFTFVQNGEPLDTEETVWICFPENLYPIGTRYESVGHNAQMIVLPPNDNNGDGHTTIEHALPYPDGWYFAAPNDNNGDGHTTIEHAHPYPDSWYFAAPNDKNDGIKANDRDDLSKNLPGFQSSPNDGSSNEPQPNDRNYQINQQPAENGGNDESQQPDQNNRQPGNLNYQLPVENGGNDESQQLELDNRQPGNLNYQLLMENSSNDETRQLELENMSNQLPQSQNDEEGSEEETKEDEPVPPQVDGFRVIQMNRKPSAAEQKQPVLSLSYSFSGHSVQMLALLCE